MLLVGRVNLRANGARCLIPCDALGPLCAGSTAWAAGIQKASSQKTGDEFQFVGGKTFDETPGAGAMGTIGTRNQCRYQGTSHGKISCW